MNTVEIYLCKPDTPYLFASYQQAQTELSLKDYNNVFGFYVKHEITDIQALLENIFMWGQSAIPKTAHCRSISTSDIIKINDTYYYVDNIGFKEVQL